MLIQVELDQRSALHAAIALRRYLDACEYDVGEPFRDLLRSVDLAKYGGQNRTPDEGDRDTGTDAPAFLTRRAFAARCGRSERTVRRWIAAGKVRATVTGIPASELERLKGTRWR